MSDGAWSLSGLGPQTYESHQVPSTFMPLAQLLLDRVGLKDGQKVLDVACGTGVVARLAAPIVGKAGKVVGTDFNAAMLDVARQNQPEASAEIEWQQADATALPFANALFDVVVCQQGLQFFPDKLRALREMRRVLVPEGRVWLAVWRSPDHSPVNSASNKVLAHHLGEEVAKISLAPFSLGEADDLRRLLTASGFRNIEIEATEIVRQMLPPDVSIPALLTSLPIGPQMAALDVQTRAIIVAEISEALDPYRTEKGLSVPQGTHIISATT